MVKDLYAHVKIINTILRCQIIAYHQSEECIVLYCTCYVCGEIKLLKKIINNEQELHDIAHN